MHAHQQHRPVTQRGPDHRGPHPHTHPTYGPVKDARHRLRELTAGTSSVIDFMIAARDELVALNIAVVIWEKATKPGTHMHIATH